MALSVFMYALRFGLVVTLALWFSVLLWMNFPVTANVKAPHFDSGLVAVFAIAALAAFGAWNAAQRTSTTVSSA